MNVIAKTLLGAVGAFALTATAASAAIVCNDEGECWHVRGAVQYKPEVKLHVHPDDWKWAEHEHFKWREHEGRGYWRGGKWVEIK
jgi:hypothetical protein